VPGLARGRRIIGFFKDNNIRIHEIALSTGYLGKAAIRLQNLGFFGGIF
jgi:hypothetical protein